MVAVALAGVKVAQRKVHSDNLVAYGNSFVAERSCTSGSTPQVVMYDRSTGRFWSTTRRNAWAVPRSPIVPRC